MPTAPTVIGRASTIAGPGKGNADRFVPQIQDMIWNYGPNLNPLIRLAYMNKKRSVKNQTFKILNDKRLPRFTRINNGAGYNTSATSIIVDNGNYFRVGDVGEVTRTKEHFFVTAISTNTLTVVRGYDTGAAGTGVAMVDNDEVRVLGQAQSERAATPSIVTTDPGTITNYCQVMSRAIGLSVIRDHTEEYGPKEKARQKQQQMDEFKIDCNNFFMFGKPLADVEASSPLDSSVADSRYKTGGLKYWIDNSASANVLNAGGVITQTTFWNTVAPLYEDMPEDSTNQTKELIALCGRSAFFAFHQWALPTVQTSPGIKSLGFALSTIQAPVGKINLVQDYSLKGDEYADYCFLVNPNDLEYVYMDGLDMQIKPNVQLPNVKEVIDEVWGVIGLGIKRPELHGYIYNMNAGA